MAIISSKQQPPDPNLPEDIAPARRKKAAKPQAESLLESQELPDEINSKQDDKIRPQRLAEYIGQKDLREVLAIAIAAAKSRANRWIICYSTGRQGWEKPQCR